MNDDGRLVEELIEDYWAEVQLPVELQAQVETLLMAEFRTAQAEADVANRKLVEQQRELTQQQTKLLQAHYAGAVPLDLMKSEQARIGGQLEAIESKLQAATAAVETVQANLKLALDLAADCHQAYLRGSDQVRRLLNHAFFEAIYVDEDDVTARLAEPFHMLLGPEVTDAARGQDIGPADEPSGYEPEPVAALGSANGRTRDWSAAYIRLIRNRGQKTNNPADGIAVAAGLKHVTLVPRWEPSLSELVPRPDSSSRIPQSA